MTIASRTLDTRSRSPISGEVTAESCLVPIIDIAPLVSGDAAGKERVAKEIGDACADIGFFVVVNHGIPTEVVDAAWDNMTQFFDQPIGMKQAMATDDEATYPYGYSALGGEILSKGKDAERGNEEVGQKRAGDMKEMFAIGPQDERSGMPERRLPLTPDGLAAALAAYYEHANDLARKLLSAFAIALELDEDWFESKLDRHISALRSINYPNQDGIVVPAGAIRASAHTDYGTVTILKSGGPGLQVSKDKENPVWHDVPFIEDGFVINLGDLMRRWTNDKWSSTLHRVINPPEGKKGQWGRRLSLAFFHNLNKDAVVEAIPSCISADSPALYDPIVAGEFLMLKHLASIGKAASDAHLKRRDA
eukprot:CAMPEP_0172697224 /NCGR_PEP_ID=MMETSP1074-20121228/28593_1 /TAXON_ID=2916 /ORGANISM="Ceratium fusus, Strain PA161109" /LENGTH=363 /DNA_ID=CAMNT_0013518087 /DNA_START=61 /DNA_END=1152 /DNA_ORIENTATION=-